MKFHDFHLKGYSVLDYGSRIVLDLLYDYPDVEKEESRIEFRDVACYFFKHTTGAIIIGIEEVDLAVLIKEEAELLSSFAHQSGLKYWRTDIAEYLDTLRKEKLRAWRLESAIGFNGFVIGGSVEGSP